MSDIKLLPCPFCGNPGGIFHATTMGFFTPYCTNEDGCDAELRRCATQDEAIKLWNTRHTQDTKAELGKKYNPLMENDKYVKLLLKFMIAVGEELKCLPSFADPSPEDGNKHIVDKIKRLLNNSTAQDTKAECPEWDAIDKLYEWWNEYGGELTTKQYSTLGDVLELFPDYPPSSSKAEYKNALELWDRWHKSDQRRTIPFRTWLIGHINSPPPENTDDKCPECGGIEPLCRKCWDDVVEKVSKESPHLKEHAGFIAGKIRTTGKEGK